MALQAVHLLLTYRCPDACPHCFWFSGPHQLATFSLDRIERILDQFRRVPSVRWVYLEGGEPFLYYPLLLETTRLVRDRGFAVAAVTNGYFLTTERDLAFALRPLVAAGLCKLQVSIDDLHRYRRLDHFRAALLEAGRRLRLTTQILAVEEPEPNAEPLLERAGHTITEGEIAFRGRAALRLAPQQALWAWDSFDRCPHERLEDPLRVHVDPHGYVHLCQGVLLGNLEGEPLDALLADYAPGDHPVVGPLLRGGPANLVREHDLAHDEGYADACHLCFHARSQLRERFPEHLGPPSVYGVREPVRRAPGAPRAASSPRQVEPSGGSPVAEQAPADDAAGPEEP